MTIFHSYVELGAQIRHLRHNVSDVSRGTASVVNYPYSNIYPSQKIEKLFTSI